MQQRLRNYRNELTSFNHNIFNLGLHAGGRYMGFDTFVITQTNAGVSTQGKITHTASGLFYKTPQNTLMGPTGTMVTNQGVLVMQDSELTGLTIDFNLGNNYRRYDLLVAYHNYTIEPLGSDVTFSIIKGPTGTPVKPNLTDPNRQVVLGYFVIEPNSGTFQYTKQRPPDSGDSVDAALSYPNKYTGIQAFSKSLKTYTTYHERIVSPTTGELWELNLDGNTFKIAPTVDHSIDGLRFFDLFVPQEGMDIDLQINEKTYIRNPYNGVLPGAWGDTYKPITFNDTFISASFGTLPAISPVGETWVVKLKFLDGVWQVMNIEGRTNNTIIPKGACINWDGDFSSNFDGTGLGINAMKGWAVRNGLNGTRDARRRVSIAADNIGGSALDASLLYNYAYDEIGGDESVGLSVSNLPSYNLPLTQGAHTHPILGSTNSDNQGFGKVAATDAAADESAGSTEGVTINLTVGSGGSNVKHKNLPPFITDIPIVKL